MTPTLGSTALTTVRGVTRRPQEEVLTIIRVEASKSTARERWRLTMAKSNEAVCPQGHVTLTISEMAMKLVNTLARLKESDVL